MLDRVQVMAWMRSGRAKKRVGRQRNSSSRANFFRAALPSPSPTKNPSKSLGASKPKCAPASPPAMQSYALRSPCRSPISVAETNPRALRSASDGGREDGHPRRRFAGTLPITNRTNAPSCWLCGSASAVYDQRQGAVASDLDVACAAFKSFFAGHQTVSHSKEFSLPG